MQTGTIELLSPNIFGNPSIHPDGHSSGFSMAIESGAFPDSHFRITSAYFTVKIRNPSWAVVDVHSLHDDLHLASFNISGVRDHTIALIYGK